MAQEDVQVVLDQFAATNERDFPRAMSYYADDVELFVHPGAFLSGGEFHGREAVGQWFADWFTTFVPGYRFDIEEARNLGDAVLLVASHRGRGRASGVEVQGNTSYIYEVRDGKIIRAALFDSREDALGSVGISD
jgi:ketosteroid isomerase-like protein